VIEFYTRKNKSKQSSALVRVCFPVRDFPQISFCLPIMGVATPPPPPLLSMSACPPRPCTMNPPSVIFGWENKWLMRYSCHFPVILFYFFLSPSFYEYVIIVLFFQNKFASIVISKLLFERRRLSVFPSASVCVCELFNGCTHGKEKLTSHGRWTDI